MRLGSRYLLFKLHSTFYATEIRRMKQALYSNILAILNIGSIKLDIDLIFMLMHYRFYSVLNMLFFNCFLSGRKMRHLDAQS